MLRHLLTRQDFDYEPCPDCGDTGVVGRDEELYEIGPVACSCPYGQAEQEKEQGQ